MAQLVKTGKLSVDGDDVASQKMIDQAKQAFAAGSSFLGLALLYEAILQGGIKDHDTIMRMAQKHRMAIASIQGGCTVSSATNDLASATLLYDQLKLKMRAIKYAESGDIWNIDVETKSTNSKNISGAQIIGKKVEYEETDRSRIRREQAYAQKVMVEAAAERAAEKAQRARVEAAGEASKNVVDKMAAGQFKVENNGGQKTMTYGSGNWAGQASAATLNAQRSNTEAANNLQAQARAMAAPDAELQAVERTLREAKNTDVWQIVRSATITLKGKKRRFEGKPENTGMGRKCNEFDRGGIKVVENCSNFNEGISYQDYVTRYFTPQVSQYIEAELYKKGLVECERKSKSKDKLVWMEGQLLCGLYGKAIDAGKWNQDVQSLFGRSRSMDGVVSSALSMF